MPEVYRTLGVVPKEAAPASVGVPAVVHVYKLPLKKY